LEEATANENASADQLRILIGYTLTQPVETISLGAEMPDDAELSRFSAAAIAERPELAKLLAERRAAEQEAKGARAERFPQFTFAIDGGFISNSLNLPIVRDSSGMRATVGITIPLFDWGASRSRQKQAELRAQRSESSRILAQRQFTLQFNTNLAQARSASARVRLATTNVNDAQSVLEISIARYRAGEARIIEVTDAQNQLVSLRSALYQAVFDYRIAEAKLRQATGK